MSKIKIEYIMDVHFVDSTYWDDGSRYTKRTFKFEDEKVAKEAKKEILKNGMKFTSHVSGKVAMEYVHDKENIIIYKITTERLGE